MASAKFKEISPADFFYRNRDIAGFTNLTRSTYMAVRELVENSLDACENERIRPDVIIRISILQSDGEKEVLRVSVQDNGSGVPAEVVPMAFARVLYGSKYTMRQNRGTFGLGGKMAYLYGQITTHEPLEITTSTGKDLHTFKLMMDITNNKPIVLEHRTRKNNAQWKGTVVSFSLEGNYTRAAQKILEYIKQTAMVAPYANLTLIDPQYRMARFSRSTDLMPKPPNETLPHPYGVDVEMVRKMISETNCNDMVSFMTKNFHRVGKNTARKFLKYVGISPSRNPKNLRDKEVVEFTRKLLSFDDFLPPDPSSLSPLGEELLREGIKKELSPEFVSVESRKASAYSGHPFIVEVGVAYGGEIASSGRILLFRFANRIPLLYDESSDVSWKIISEKMNWRHYKIPADEGRIAVIVHICSTKIPYKNVGKEYIADRPEIEREIINGLRTVARELSKYLSRQRAIVEERKRVNVFEKYLPMIARYLANTCGYKKPPDVSHLVREGLKYILYSDKGRTPKEA
ncbi:DNA topoisomerase VI subunit B [Candidatus Bathyarchaeota archaeon]|nr:DNA topoisomerase VI subunit B [Candidatus Bathyarchaeota archaeon]